MLVELEHGVQPIEESLEPGLIQNGAQLQLVLVDLEEDLQGAHVVHLRLDELWRKTNKHKGPSLGVTVLNILQDRQRPQVVLTRTPRAILHSTKVSCFTSAAAEDTRTTKVRPPDEREE